MVLPDYIVGFLSLALMYTLLLVFNILTVMKHDRALARSGGFRSPTAAIFAGMGALGFLGALGFVPGCERLFGFMGFFGFIGVAYIIETACRRGNKTMEPRN